MEFYKILEMDPMIQIRNVSYESITENKRKIYIQGFIDLDESSGINGKFKFAMKDKSFHANFIGKTTPPLGTMRLSQLHKIMS